LRIPGVSQDGLVIVVGFIVIEALALVSSSTVPTWGSFAAIRANLTECHLSDVAENAVSFAYRLIGIPLFLHTGRHAKFQLAPAFRHITHSEENDFVFRTGFLWDLPVGKMTLTPGIWYDIAEGQDLFIFGVGVGTGF
jgi:hypothetical protein